MNTQGMWQPAGIAGVLLVIGCVMGATVTAQGPDPTSPTDTLTPWAYLPAIMRGHVSTRTPNDPYYTDGTQWNLNQIEGPAAWAQTTGSSAIIIAIVDTGVDADHPDLSGKTVAGYDFVNDDANPADDNGHGTHCAGIAAALTDNGTGVAGVSWGARIMPIKVLNRWGSGYASWIAAGIVWAADHGAKVINLSLAGEGYSQTELDAVNYAYGKGCLLVAAVGNCGDPTYYSPCSTHNPPLYPASFDHVLGVGATGDLDERAVYSEYGFFVDVTAPGGNPSSNWDPNPRHWIMSTYWRATGHSYAQVAGTSQAAPHVSGLAALVWTQSTGLTPDQVQAIIQAEADDRGPAGWDPEYGYGRINAAKAVGRSAAGSVRAGPARPPATATPPASVGPAAALAPGVVLVKLQPGARPTTLDAHGLTVLDEIPGRGVLRVRVPVGQERAVAQALSHDPAVAYAEPDLLRRAQ